MKTITQLFDHAFAKAKDRSYDRIYVAVDLHDTIISGNYSNSEVSYINDDALPALMLMNDHPMICLILWTSIRDEEKLPVLDSLLDDGVNFQALNSNPFEGNTAYADFSEKFYFSVLLDDKAGFEPSDWAEVRAYFNNLTGQQQ